MAVAAISRTPSLEQHDVVVVGAGPVGIRCAERLCSEASGPTVVVLGDEPWRPYDRVRLSSFVARDLTFQALDETQRLRPYGRLSVLTERRVMRIDRERREVCDQRGGRFRYSKLVLATGSRARVPAIPGVELPGVFRFRDLSDAQRLLARQIGSRATVVIGGGLLGLEAARAMLRFNTRVYVVEHEPYLMFKQLDVAAAALLRAHVEALGIEVRTGASVQQIIGIQAPLAVRLKSGEEIECDTVVVAAGVVPNVELARDARLSVGHGIRVNDRMQTSDPEIYAVGECAEHRGRLYGLVGPGIEQAAVAAENILDRPAEYWGTLDASSLKVAGCAVFSMGEVHDAATLDCHKFVDGHRYRRINVRDGRLAGAVGFGEWDVARLRAAGLKRRRVWPWQLLRFRREGELWPQRANEGVAAWPAATVVCSCRGLARGALTAAIEGGATSIADLQACTGASTVCGSCKPLLADLLGAPHAPAPVARGLLATSAAAGVLAALAYAVSAPYRTSVGAAWQWDVLWTDSLYKQVSGFTLLALALLLSTLSLRKRIASFRWARYSSWQLGHAALGLFTCGALAVHTGFRFGANLNLWLMVSFTALLAAGALGGVAIAVGPRLRAARAQSLRAWPLWVHVLLLWPLPALLGFHMLAGYYF
jgi:nitrite reductase (NADH) large subunit